MPELAIPLLLSYWGSRSSNYCATRRERPGCLKSWLHCFLLHILPFLRILPPVLLHACHLLRKNLLWHIMHLFRALLPRVSYVPSIRCSEPYNCQIQTDSVLKQPFFHLV